MLSFTVSIIIVTCIVSLTGFNSNKVIDDLIFWPPAIRNRNQYYRFITCGFIHADYIHLAFNMITMYFFGVLMEQIYVMRLELPAYTFLVLYIGALIVSNIPTYLKHRNDYNYRSLGASGAVSAVLFAFILVEPWVTIYVLFIPVPAIVYAVIFLIYSAYKSRKGGDYINHDAHFYGALFGILFTIAVKHEVLGIFLRQLAHPQFNLS